MHGLLRAAGGRGACAAYSGRMKLHRLVRLPLASLVASALAALALTSTLTGCAGTAPADGSPGAGRSGVEVFGTIDAGVSRTTNKSERR